MKSLLISLLAVFSLPTNLYSSHLNNQKELIVTSESTKESVALAKFLKDNDVIKYDGHPNESGHIKIAKNIISSNSKTSLDNFIQSSCK